MISILGAETAGDSIIKFFQGIVASASLDTVLFVFAGIMAAIFIACIIRLIWCYESRAMRQMRRINKYLKDNPKINDSNLVEFHNKMRKLPRRFRDRWQLFMLEREGSPSRYMTVEYCVKRPLYNSAILTVKKQIAYATIIVSVLALFASIALIVDKVLNVATFFQIILVPMICVLFGCLFCMILHLRYTSVNNTFYDVFTNFIRNIDKSTNAMPDYVDYELLFTPKEINAGIPVLREYLEKRALEEQRLLEKAKQEEANHSPYNFADLGVNGSQLIERAVTESEKFMMTKLQIQQEITDLEKQLQKTEANMEDIEREANRKLQAIKENLERLDKTMAETTNRVEINYNRRQATEEMNKKQKLEKDLENMLGKEQVAVDALKVEIQKRKEIIETNKEQVETSLKSEYDTFATKVYQELSDKVTRDNSEQMRDMEMVIARLKAKVQEYNKDIEKRDNLVEARSIEVENLRRELHKAKDLLKANGKKGKNKGEAIANVDELIKDPTHYEPNEVRAQPDEFVAESMGEPMPDQFEPVVNDEFVPVEMQPQDNFEPVPGEMPYDGAMQDNGMMPADMTGNGEFISMDNGAMNDQFVDEGYIQPADEFGVLPQDEFMPVDAEQMPQDQQFEAPVADEFAPVEQANSDQFAPVDEFAPVENFAEQPVVEPQVEPAENVIEPMVEPQVEQVAEDEAKDKSNDENKPATKSGQIKKTATKVARPAKKSADKDEKSTEKASEKEDKSETKAKEKDAAEEKAKSAEAKRVSAEEKAKAEAAEKEKAEIKKKVDELHAELEKSKQEIQEIKEDKEEKKSAEKDELEALQEQINAENERLKKQQEELRAQIDETLQTMEKATNATKAERTRNIKKIKDLIAKLKAEAAEAKERGASRAEINKINKSAAELLKVITDYQANKPISSRSFDK